MSKSTLRLILRLLKITLLFLFGLLFTGFAMDKLPEWCSPWWTLVVYCLYVGDVIWIEFV